MKRILPALSMCLLMVACAGRPPAGLGIQNGKPADCPSSPNCVSSFADDADHRIEPISYTGDRKQAMSKLKQVLKGLERTSVISENEEYIHAECTSLIFRFVDDIEFYFPAEEKVIHVRSASRMGYSDLGVNRKRVTTIRQRFEME